MTAARKAKPIDTSPEAAERRMLLGRLHALKKRMGLDDDTYRAKLQGFTGKSSAADLDAASLREVLNLWSKALPTSEQRTYTATRRSAELSDPQQRAVRALWIALWNMGALEDGSDKALDAFIERQAKVSSLAFLRAHKAASVIEALKDMLAREGVTLHDGRLKGREGRIALVRAQWAKVASVKHEGALISWLCGAGRVVPGMRALAQLSDDQLDDASKKLGRWIRDRKAAAGR